MIGGNTKRNYCVYMHTSPCGKKYIGQTCIKPESRWANGKGYSGSPYFYNAIQKYGWENFKHEILKENLSKEEANELEIYYICEYNTQNKAYGYNISSGGKSRQPSKEAIERCKELFSKDVYQFKHDGTFLNHFNSCLEAAQFVNGVGHGVSGAARGDLYQYKNYLWSYDENGEDILDKINSYNSIAKRMRIKQYTKKGIYLNTFDNAQAAAAVVKSKDTIANRAKGIHKACKKITMSSYGFIWRYEVEDTEEVKPFKSNYLKPSSIAVNQYTLNNEYVKSYESIKYAARETGIAFNSIRRCVHKEYKTAGGYLWERASGNNQ